MLLKEFKKGILPLIYLLLFCLIYFFFYPEIYSLEDEAAYFGMGYVLSKGTLYPDTINTKIIHTYFNGKHQVTKHPLGISILMAPIFFIDYHFVFLIPFLIFIIGYVFFLKLLQKNSLPLYLSFLYLFFPPFVLYSRTLMSDLVGAVFILIAFNYFLDYKKSSDFVCGFFCGISVLFKYPNILFLLATGITLVLDGFFSDCQNSKFRRIITDGKLYRIVIGALPAGIIVTIINYYLYNHPLSLPQNTGYFALKHFPSHFIYYFIVLIIVYPLMLLTGIFLKYTGRRIIIISIFLYLLFYSPYYFIQKTGDFINDLIISQRFLFPAIILMLLPYAEFFHRLSGTLKKNTDKLLIALSIFGLISCAFLITIKHQRFLGMQRYFRDVIYKETDEHTTIFLDETTQELIQNIWGKRNFSTFDYQGALAIELSDLNFERSGEYAIIYRVRDSNKDYIDNIAQELNKMIDTVCGRKEVKSFRYKGFDTVMKIIKLTECL